MSGLFGIDDLWAADDNLRVFRRDRSKFIEAVRYWEAVAANCIGETAAQFCAPRREFQTFTELLGMAAAQLFDIEVPAVREFARKCLLGGDPPPRPEPRTWDESDQNALRQAIADSARRRTNSADILASEDSIARYWEHFDADFQPPDPRDLRAALDETRRLCEVATLPPPSTSKCLCPESSEWSKPRPIAHWARVFGIDRGTMKKWFESSNVRAVKVAPRAWKVLTEDLPSNTAVQ